MVVLRLTDAQRSALECAGLDHPSGDEDFDRRVALVRSAWRGPKFIVVAGVRDELGFAVTDLANSEDASALEATDVEARRHARSACRALSTLASRVWKAFEGANNG